jgi:divalent metal cation (Fe/Co/Zn/Cd) transporter
MAGFLLRHRRSVATVVAAAAFVLVDTVRRAAADTPIESRPWPSIVALVYCAVTAGSFVYLRSDRAREALEATDSSLAEAQIIVALSPTVVASALYFTGAAIWVMWFVLGITVALLIIWSWLPKDRSHDGRNVRRT